ncbi:hypothetical protein GDI2373 [Gluconacetobacter diazotrophicus PA1 5]|uniref:Uncharacterized protein n=1 Tax=Gluconacetobacter diazotrophicus (strain ATCC 49037 / DSM 5601 / CCUG 37298 / CIP 103539 / LMG 7603 / PAl5) TaxID=272568 RepID=A9HMJ6_GLUDA|nr:hypothetical protein GDI2373 [Gluconacetobacter diazotrophicus PA1 5]
MLIKMPVRQAWNAFPSAVGSGRGKSGGAEARGAVDFQQDRTIVQYPFFRPQRALSGAVASGGIVHPAMKKSSSAGPVMR